MILSRKTIPAPIFIVPPDLGPALGQGGEGREGVLPAAAGLVALHAAQAVCLAVAFPCRRAVDRVLAEDD